MLAPEVKWIDNYSCLLLCTIVVSDIIGWIWVNDVYAQGADEDIQTYKGGGARRLDKTSE
jgi:hypothetical protein